MNHLQNIRRTLHQHPELSGEEFQTRERILAFMQTLSPDRVELIGRTGIAFVFSGNNHGKHIIFRAELDALPIREEGSLSYQSTVEGLGHLCGHDGHMTILLGLAERIAQNRPDSGKVILLFQPAEEIGSGAMEMVNDPFFRELEPDYIFALHNIPGEPLKQILVRQGTFCASSRGMTIKLRGRTSHAAHPEEAISPVMAIASFISDIQSIHENQDLFDQTCFATIVHIQMGEIAFGTTPGYAEIRLTLRAFKESDIIKLCRIVEGKIRSIAFREKLDLEYRYSEVFPSVENDNEAVEIIINAAKEVHLGIKNLPQAFLWSEDFGYYVKQYKCGYFGLGAGENHPGLHQPDYDFPDELLEKGIDIFYAIYRKTIL